MIQSTTLDKFGILLSGVCMIHCLVTPVLVTLVPVLSLNVWVEDFLFHQLMLWLVIPTSCIALFLGCRKHKKLSIVGCRKHKKLSIVATGIVGITVLLFVAFFGHDLLDESMEKVVMTIGGLIVAASHYLNFRACQSITCSTENCATEHHH